MRTSFCFLVLLIAGCGASAKPQAIPIGDVPANLVQTAQVRLRPVLMTAFTLVASMLPVCFHLAPGGEAMIPLARALVGGMMVSTLMTLFLVPCVYSLVKRPLAVTQVADNLS